MINETKLEALLAEIGEQYMAHYSIHGDPSIWVGVEIPDYKKCGTATQWIRRFKICDMPTDGPEYGRVRTEMFVAALNELPQLLADLAAEKARADAAEKERDALREALENIINTKGIQHPITMAIRHNGYEMKLIARAAIKRLDAQEETR